MGVAQDQTGPGHRRGHRQALALSFIGGAVYGVLKLVDLVTD